jgi:hypothetical protein
LAALALVVSLGGCTVATHEPGPTAPAVVSGNAITIDLRRQPTRDDLGFRPGSNASSYQRGTRGLGPEPIDTTVVLPTGTLRVPAFNVKADEGDLDPNPAIPRPPQHIIVQRTFDTAQETTESLLADAPTLGYAQSDVDTLLSRVGPSAGSHLPQRGVINGLVHEWLAAYVEVTANESGTLGVNYNFTINVFHNPAVDKVVRDGVYPIDLTHRPSREELAFRDGYAAARVEPAWNETLSVLLTLPDGVLNHPIRTVYSSKTYTDISLASSSVTDARQTLLADAPALGITPTAVDEVFAGRSGFVKTTLTGRSTPVWSVSVKVEVTLDQPGAFAASLMYRFTYH